MTDYGAGTVAYRPPVDAVKDPNSVEDFKFVWILNGDTIVTSEFTSDYLGIESETFTDTTATVFLSGGVEGQIAKITHRITTTQGRTYDATRHIQLKEL